MANTKISALPVASTLDGTEIFPLVQAGATSKGSVAQLDARFVKSSNTQGGTLVAPTSTELFRFQPRDPARAPFGPLAVLGGGAFNGTWDSVGYGCVAYNTADTGGRILNTEPRFNFNIEASYNDGTGIDKMECYFEEQGISGVIHRPIFMQFRRDTGRLTSFTMETENLTFLRETDQSQWLAMGAGAFTMLRQTGLSSSFALQAASGQGSAFYLEHNAVNTLLISTIAAGQTRIAPGTNANGHLFGFNGVGWSVNLYDNTHALGVGQVSTGQPAFRVQKIASATADMVQLRAEDATTILYRFDKNGYPINKKNAAPADADLGAGEMAIWFDSTNGASKLMVKAKQADGTVKTASLALS